MIEKGLRFAANNAVGLVALFVALGGVSYAATGGFVASTAKLTACVGESHVVVLKTGKKGCRHGQKTIVWDQTGPAGAHGAAGAPGAPGAPGANGANGASALSPLPSGASESGEFSIVANGALPEFMETAYTFNIPLSAPIDESHINYTGSKTSNCPGPGSAARGFLCIYTAGNQGVTSPLITNTDTGTRAKGAGRIGFDAEWEVIGPGPFDKGTYTVTAP